MCGIIGVIRKKDATKNDNSVAGIVHEILEDQISRGREGFGIVKMGNEGETTVLRATELLSSLLQLRFDVKGAKGILYHHRHPTSTPNKLGQTHPIFVSNEALANDYLVIHNGIIRNDHIRKPEHEKLGFKYTTEIESETGNYIKFNDSESLAIDFALAVEGKEKTVLSTGSAAVLALQLEKKTGRIKNFLAWRVFNPINFFEDKEHFIFSSEGIGESLASEELMTIDFDTMEKKTQTLKQYTEPAKPVPVTNHYPAEFGRATHTHYPGRNGGTVFDNRKSQIDSELPKGYQGPMRYDASRGKLVPNPPIGFKTVTESTKTDEDRKIEDEAAAIMENDSIKVDWDKVLDNPKVQEIVEDMEYSGDFQDVQNEIEDAFAELSDLNKIEKLNRKKSLKRLCGALAEVYNKSFNDAREKLDQIRNIALNGDEPYHVEELEVCDQCAQIIKPDNIIDCSYYGCDDVFCGDACDAAHYQMAHFPDVMEGYAVTKDEVEASKGLS